MRECGILVDWETVLSAYAVSHPYTRTKDAILESSILSVSVETRGSKRSRCRFQDVDV